MLMLQMVLVRKESPAEALMADPAIKTSSDGYTPAAGRIFGVVPVTNTDVVTSAGTSLELQGVLVAGDPAQSIADMLTDGKEVVLTVGDSLADGEKLERVDSTSVTLSRSGVERRITLQIQGALLGSISEGPRLDDGSPDASDSASRLPVINVNAAAGASVADRLSELRSQVLRGQMKKARSRKPPSASTHASNAH
jgi:type II secretory pathway component PulC